jgi:N-acetylmuramoyl-L-alanine amidase
MKDMIIVHCSDTYTAMDVGAKEIRDWHVNGNGWSDIGYNYVIRRNGKLESGRDLDGDGNVDEETGAHARGFNTRSIGICLIGGKGLDDKPESNFTYDQYSTLEILVNNLKRKYGIKRIVGHCDLDSRKTCPNFNVKSFFGAD